jgi:hypothetical protein
MATKKHRFYHSLSWDRTIRTVGEALAVDENSNVLLAVNEDTTDYEVVVGRMKKESIDTNRIRHAGDIYSDPDHALSMVNHDTENYCWPEHFPDEEAFLKSWFPLLVLVDYANRTPNISKLLVKTNLVILSTTARRIPLPMTEDDLHQRFTAHSDPKFLYGRPPLPDFENLTDEQHARFVRDNTRSLEDLFPVYDQDIEPIDFHSFLGKTVPAREPLLLIDGVPLLLSEFIVEWFGYRGTGKSLWLMFLALLLAAGKKRANLEAPKAVPVVFVDGELPESQSQDRLKKLSAGLDIPKGNLTLIARSQLRPGVTLDITTEGTRAAIEGAIENAGARVVILDSLKSLGVKTTMDPLLIAELNAWFSRLRCKGLCVNFAHHAGVSGAQRGLSDIEDPLDLSIKLEARSKKSTGAAFKMSFTKEREEGRLPSHGYVCENGVWSVDDSAARVEKPEPVSKETQVREMVGQKVPIREIAEQLGVSSKTISKLKKEMGDDDSSEATQ